MPSSTAPISTLHPLRNLGEVVQRDHPADVRADFVGQHAGAVMLEDPQGAPADLGRDAVPAHEVSDELQQRLRVVALLLHVHVLRRVPVARNRRDQAARRGVREAAVLAVGPLHRRAHRLAARDLGVLAHSDLLAVEQHRRAGQGEQQAVDHADAARIAPEHRRQSAGDAPVVDALGLVGRERVEDLLAFRVGQLVERELVVVADEIRPRRLGRHGRARGQRLRRGAPDRCARATGTEPASTRKSNCRSSSPPRSPPKNCSCCR